MVGNGIHEINVHTATGLYMPYINFATQYWYVTMVHQWSQVGNKGLIFHLLVLSRIAFH